MKVAEIWRYPVKTMAGEKLLRALVGSLWVTTCNWCVAVLVPNPPRSRSSPSSPAINAVHGDS
jgi:hypothetical protein